MLAGFDRPLTDLALAWLGGVGLEGAASQLWAREFRWGRLTLGLWQASVVSLGLVSVATLGWIEGLADGFEHMMNSPPVEKVPLAAALMRNRGNARWAFTDREMYAFQAGLAVPPELASLSERLFWMKAPDSGSILSSVRRYGPERILLAGPLRRDFTFTHEGIEQRTRIGGDALGKYLALNYEEVYHDRTGSLYSRKPPPASAEAEPERAAR